ncbi:MAG TPA: hypothetical protein DIT89_05000 [Planctomycetaceae bacterium]|nr:hypothetical protein [Planctomycetaceae bacterium]
MLDGDLRILRRLGDCRTGTEQKQSKCRCEAGDEIHHGSPKSVVGMPDKFRLLTLHSIPGFQIG